MRFYQLDNDTKKYIKRLNYNGFKTPTDITSVDQFIRGLKDMGIWSNTIFWALRANQNAGSGTTAYSLSGLGTYNGTLTNGPTWQANGIRSTGIGIPPPNIVLNNTNLSSYSQRTFFAVINPLANTTDNVVAITSNYGFSFAGSGTGMSLGFGAGHDLGQAGQNGNFSSISTTALTFSIFSSIALTYNAGPIVSYRNGTTNGTNSSGTLRTLTDTNPIRLMAMNGGTLNDRGLNGIFAFFADIRIALSADQILGLNSLYKSTIGKGLALP